MYFWKIAENALVIAQTDLARTRYAAFCRRGPQLAFFVKGHFENSKKRRVLFLLKQKHVFALFSTKNRKEIKNLRNISKMQSTESQILFYC